MTAVNVRHAKMAADGGLVQEHGTESFGVVPVSRDLRDAWRDALASTGRTAEVEWCWRNPSSMPAREMRKPAVAEIYQRLRKVIALGQSLLDEHSVHDVWAEATDGPSHFNNLISNAPLMKRGASSETSREFEVVALVRKKVVEDVGCAGAGAASSEWVEPKWAELGLDKPAKAPSPFKILFVGVNANEAATLKLKEEYKTIVDALDKNYSKLAHDRPVVKQIPYSTWCEVMEEVQREHPSALIFGLHSDEEKGIELHTKTVRPEEMVVAIGAWNDDARAKGRNEVRPPPFSEHESSARVPEAQ